MTDEPTTEPAKTFDLRQLRRQLAALPVLADRIETEADDRPGLSGGGTSVRVAPGSKPPPGVDLGSIDREHGRQPHPLLLARISQCIRVAVEEMTMEAYRTTPGLPPEGDETWSSECRWLLATMAIWAADAWSLEWIATEVEEVHRTLRHSVERLTGRKLCTTCGAELVSYESQTLAVVECPACERVVGMRERRFLTTKQAAGELGISDRAVRKQIQRGQLPATTSDTGGYLVADDHLDWARRKLGIPTKGADVC